MADKKSLFDKYKIVGEDGNEKSADEVVSEVIGGEIIEIPEEDNLPVVEALTGFPDAVKEALEKLPVVDEIPTSYVEEEFVFDTERINEAEEESAEAVVEEIPEEPETIVAEEQEPEILSAEEIEATESTEPEIFPITAFEIHEREEEEIVFESFSNNTEEELEEDEFADIKLPENLFGDEEEDEEPEIEVIPFLAPAEEKTVFEPQVEEFVFPVKEDVQQPTEPVEAPSEVVVEPKKQKKVKEPKPPKAKKVKEPKPPKEKKPKKEKAPKEPKDDTQAPEPLTMKDHLTFILAIVALLMAIAFICIRYIPMGNDNTDNPDTTDPIVEQSNNLSYIQIQREGMLATLVQSDIDNVFYSFSTTYDLQYYQYRDNKMVRVKPTGSVTANVDFGNEVLPVTIDYVQVGDKIFGIGLFRADKNPGVYFYKMAMFKLTNLPQGYGQSSKALLLATTSDSPKAQKHNVWPESFVIDLDSGKTTRFLSNVNRNIDMTTGAYVTSFCVLTNNSYMASSGKIPFFSAREYDASSGKKDIFLKSGSSETVFAKDVYGDYVYPDGNAVVYLKTNGTTGFNVVRKENNQETTLFSLYGALSSSYIYSNEYILDKVNGTLYNVKTGKETALVGYRMMNPELLSISPDGRYLMVLGYVNSMMDYQIHIFDLKTGDYKKYEELNFSPHTNLTFIDNKTAIYNVVDPNQGFEYVILDVEKAFEK